MRVLVLTWAAMMLVALIPVIRLALEIQGWH